MCYVRSELRRRQCWGSRCHSWYSCKDGQSDSSSGKKIKISYYSKFLNCSSLSLHATMVTHFNFLLYNPFFVLRLFAAQCYFHQKGSSSKFFFFQMDAKLPMDTFENVMELAIEGCKAIATHIREVHIFLLLFCYSRLQLIQVVYLLHLTYHLSLTHWNFSMPLDCPIVIYMLICGHHAPLY